MYIGNSPANVGNYEVLDDITPSFNGVLLSFPLTSLGKVINPAKSGQLLVSINGVLQEPDDTGTNGFYVSGSNIVFSSAPATGATFWCVYQGQNVDIGTPSFGTVDTVHMVDGASITGNASTATALQTARTINGVSFNGSADIVLPGAPNVYQGAYGLTWDSVTDTFIRTGASGFTSIQGMMKRCVLNTDTSVNYFLHPDNSGFKVDGSPSDLTGVDGNVMVQIPKFYTKPENVGTQRKLSVSLTPATGYVVHPAFIKAGVEVDFRYYRAYEGINQLSVLRSVSGVTPTRSQTIGTFRTWAEANGTGWHQNDWSLLDAVRTLLYIEIGTFRADDYLGTGNHEGSDYGITTGQSNGIGNGSSDGTMVDTWMSYRGIENFYGDIWEFVDGVNIQDRLVYTNNNYTSFASDVFTSGYVSTGVTLPVSSGSYVKDSSFTAAGMIPTVVGGASSTYFADGIGSTTGNRVVLFGGSADHALMDGPSCFHAYANSGTPYSTVGAGVSC